MADDFYLDAEVLKLFGLLELHSDNPADIIVSDIDG